MNRASNMQQLSLVVTNPEALQQGSTPRHQFGAAGGTIGSGQDTWVLADRAHRIQSAHCEIVRDGEGFAVIDRSGQTRINDHIDPIGRDVCVALSEGDRLQVGPYRLGVHLEDESYAVPDRERRLAQYDVMELLQASAEPQLDEAAAPAIFGAADHATVIDSSAEFRALSAPSDAAQSTDPLAALDADAQLHDRGDADAFGILDRRHYGLSSATTQPDLAATRFEAVSGPPRAHPQTVRTASTAARASAQQDSTAQLAEPLCEGLAAALGPLDAQRAQELQLDAGKTIRGLVQGLLALRTAQSADAQRLGARPRTLQPIEDNPLQLGLDYPSTVRALFSSERSPVHLSPSAAVQESLEQLLRQQQATRQAIEAGLDALLQAFSPARLLQRFQRYQTGSDAEHEEGDWAWNMFRSYYDELASARQQGFHKLFWEVFDQHFDRVLRAEAP